MSAEIAARKETPAYKKDGAQHMWTLRFNSEDARKNALMLINPESINKHGVIQHNGAVQLMALGATAAFTLQTDTGTKRTSFNSQAAAITFYDDRLNQSTNSPLGTVSPWRRRLISSDRVGHKIH